MENETQVAEATQPQQPQVPTILEMDCIQAKDTITGTVYRDICNGGEVYVQDGPLEIVMPLIIFGAIVFGIALIQAHSVKRYINKIAKDITK